MNAEIKSVLEKIEEQGFEAYVVGGFVRDYLLEIESTDVDICTNALPKDIIKIFNIKKDTTSYGSITLNNGKYTFDITTYRKESSYLHRKPQSIEYTNNLLLDINRRDFTINSICMNSQGEIFDYLNGREDINNKIIRVIGNTTQKLTEDPLRILRAIRFAIVLNFRLDDNIYLFIKNNKNIFEQLSYTRRKEELDKIFSSKNAEKGINLLKELNLLPYLDIDYDTIITVPDILGIWAQINFSKKYPFNKHNRVIIENIRSIISKGSINNYTVFKYGLYISLVAGEILNYNKTDINEMYHSLPIKTKQDLNIKQIDIIKILNIVPSSKIKIIYEELIEMVVNNKIPNQYDKLKNYILTKWK